ncbi:Rrf2 family transcriptional regulator [Paenibacillus donghaensis]|uniref:RrF2 family transcriptional regulator n=1 Tax=Paenibacillus donghaensis TaxID=414771 RepID=UPI001883DC98|nr:Rrf2 family transcriptional regulator [Paenibacillus donghaensis]MBE9914825.1 Rrf2 family transcriptional regulator [Paenibacillus donghaensis]
MNLQLGTVRFRATLNVILLLAMHQGTLTSAEMSRQMNVHAAYLRHIVSPLLRQGLLEAKEGRDGGYKLRLPPCQVSLADVYEAAEMGKKKQNGMEAEWTGSANEVLDQVAAEIDICQMTCLRKYMISDVMAGQAIFLNGHS